MPDELSDEYCDVCGRQMVVKIRHASAASSHARLTPSAASQSRIVIEMPGKCPKCGSRILEAHLEKGLYLSTPASAAPSADLSHGTCRQRTNCPSCGKTLFKPSGRGRQKAFCMNEDCPEFVPEDKRGYKKKAAADSKG